MRPVALPTHLMTKAQTRGTRGQSHAVAVEPLEKGELNPLPCARLTAIWLSSSLKKGAVRDHICGLCITWMEKKATRTAKATTKINNPVRTFARIDGAGETAEIAGSAEEFVTVNAMPSVELILSPPARKRAQQELPWKQT